MSDAGIFEAAVLRIWKAAAAYAQGRRHKKEGVSCQDRALARVGKGVCVIALADGAGSCRYSDRGAEIATKKVASLVCDEFDTLWEMPVVEAVGRIVAAVREELESEAKAAGGKLTDYSSTLLFTAVKGSKYLTGHLGDGVIVRLSDAGCEVFSKPWNEVYPNVTCFTTDRRAAEMLRLQRGDDRKTAGFMLMSDGAAESLYQRKEVVLAPAVNRIFGWLESHSVRRVSVALRKNLEGVIGEATTDDTSIAVMRRCELSISSVLSLPGEDMVDYVSTRKRSVATTRLAVWMVAAAGGTPAQAAERAGVSLRTARKHLLIFRSVPGELVFRTAVS